MINVPELISSSLISSFVAYGIIRLASLFFISGEGSAGMRQVAAPVFGYFFVVSIVAILTTKGNSTYTLPFFLVIHMLRKNLFRLPSSGFEVKWIEVLILLFNVAVHWIIFFDWRNGCFFSEWIDSYQYSSNVTSIMETGSECIAQECANLKLGFNYEHAIYHYSEYYLTILIKWFFGNSSYFSLFFVSMPVIMTMAQVQAINFLNIQSRFKGFNAVAFVLGLTTCIRFINIGAVWPFEVNFWSHFPLYQITNYFNIYFYSYSGKIPLFVSMFLTLYSLWKEEKLVLFSLGMVLVTLLNLVFFPFFILFFFILFLIEKRPLRCFAFPLLLSALALLPIIILNSGKDLSIFPMKPSFDFFLNLGFQNTQSSLRNTVLYVLGNFYPHFIFLLISLFSFWRSRNLRLLILILFLFPLLLNNTYGSKIILVLCVVSGIYFYIANPGASMPVFVSLFTLLILYSVFGIFDPDEYRDFFQFYKFPIDGMACVLPLLLISEWKAKPIKYFSAIAFLFAIININENYFVNNRVYFRTNNPKNFHKEYLLKTSGKNIKAAFLSTNFQNPVTEIGLFNSTGVDILNWSDSLEIYNLGPEDLTRIDSLRMARGILAWKIYQRQPFIIFQRMNPRIKDPDNLKIAFMKQHGLSAFFRAEGNPREKMNFLNHYLSDSLYNPVEKYWIYFLNFEQKNKN